MKALVRCPNCKGRDSSHWPFGPCTICEGSGKTTEERAAEVLPSSCSRISGGTVDSSVAWCHYCGRPIP